MMLFERQFIIVLTMCYAGLIVGVAFELYRALRHGKVFSVLLDVLFALFCAGTFIVGAYVSANFDLRAYMFLSFLIGFCIYFFGISRLISAILNKISKVITKHKKRE